MRDSVGADSEEQTPSKGTGLSEEEFNQFKKDFTALLAYPRFFLAPSLHGAKVTIADTNFTRIKQCIANGDWNGAAKVVPSAFFVPSNKLLRYGNGQYQTFVEIESPVPTNSLYRINLSFDLWKSRDANMAPLAWVVESLPNNMFRYNWSPHDGDVVFMQVTNFMDSKKFIATIESLRTEVKNSLQEVNQRMRMGKLDQTGYQALCHNWEDTIRNRIFAFAQIPESEQARAVKQAEAEEAKTTKTQVGLPAEQPLAEKRPTSSEPSDLREFMRKEVSQVNLDPKFYFSTTLQGGKASISDTNYVWLKDVITRQAWDEICKHMENKNSIKASVSTLRIKSFCVAVERPRSTPNNVQPQPNIPASKSKRSVRESRLCAISLEKPWDIKSSFGQPLSDGTVVFLWGPKDGDLMFCDGNTVGVNKWASEIKKTAWDSLDQTTMLLRAGRLNQIEYSNRVAEIQMNTRAQIIKTAQQH